MMRLFFRPFRSIQCLTLCLGSLGGLGYSANAQTISMQGWSIVDRSESLGSVEEANDQVATAWVDSINDEISSFSVSASDLRPQDLDKCECQLQNSQITLTKRSAGIDISLDIDEDEEPESIREQKTDDDDDDIDDELGILRLRSQPVGIDSELGLLRIRSTEDVPLEVDPEPTRQTTVFLTGRTNVYGGNNLFRTPNPIDDRIYQVGVGIFAFPRLSDRTNLVLSAEANLARYEDLSVVDYNELQFQAGIRQRLSKRSYGQLNWRYQDLSTPGRDSFFTADYIELLLSRRDILSNRTWLDSYYQARLSMSDPQSFSRFTQIGTASLNYGFDAQTRASLLYQIFIDDYTQIRRHDTYHQVIAQVSHELSSTTRLSLFTGFRFGRSSLSTINFDDTIYGASVNVNLPLF